MNIEPNVLEAVVQYIQGTDSIIAKQASMDSAVASEAAGLVDSLVKASLLPEATKEASVQKIKEDPTYLVDLLKKAASAMKTIDPAGVGVGITKVASTQESADEAFDRALLS